MKKLLLVLVIVLCVASEAWAVSSTGLKSTGLLGKNAHAHVTTVPSRIYSVVVNPTSNLGTVLILDTKCARVNSGTGLLGREYIDKDTILADIQGATAGNTVSINFGDDGVNCGRMFVSCENAVCTVQYKE